MVGAFDLSLRPYRVGFPPESAHHKICFSYVLRPTRARPDWSVDLGEIDFDALALAAGVLDHTQSTVCAGSD